MLQWDRLSDAVYTVPRQSMIQDSYAISNEINQIIQQDTGFDARTLWVQWDKSATLGEVQTIQSNARSSLSLGIETETGRSRVLEKICGMLGIFSISIIKRY